MQWLDHWKQFLPIKYFVLYKGLSGHIETDIALPVSRRKVSPELCFYFNCVPITSQHLISTRYTSSSVCMTLQWFESLPVLPTLLFLHSNIISLKYSCFYGQGCFDYIITCQVYNPFPSINKLTSCCARSDTVHSGLCLLARFLLYVIHTSGKKIALQCKMLYFRHFPFHFRLRSITHVTKLLNFYNTACST